MFGLGIAKLLFTVAIIIVVWWGARWWARLQARERAEVARERRAAAEGPQARRPEPAGPPVEETQRCSVCDAYVPSLGVRSCGRDDCPYPR